MELLKDQVAKLKEQVSEWRTAPRIELEVGVGKFYPKPGGPKDVLNFRSGVDMQTFLRVATRLQSRGFNPLPQESYMTIGTEDGIRFRISGENVITQYCRDNRINRKAFTAMIKDSNMTEKQFKLANVDIPEYDIRARIRREIEVDETNDRVQAALDSWDRKRKYFRLIRRWTFVGKGGKFELSLVRSTFRGKDGKMSVMTFQDQDLLRVDPTYEIEFELDHDAFPPEDAGGDDAAYKALINGIGDILKGVQNSPMLIRNSTKRDALRSYRQITGLNELEFRGVKPITLELINITAQEISDKPNIRKNYNVTDKADGLRVLALVDEVGELFMIDMAFNVYKTNYKKPELKNSLLDGEYVTNTLAGVSIQRLLFFDIYYTKGAKDVSTLPFWDTAKECRFIEMNEWLKLWNADGGPEKLVRKIDLELGIKEFMIADAGNGNSIFDKAKDMLAKAELGAYHTDGLIFTPNELALPPRGAFPQQFKWKPAKDNSIDFLVTFEKNPDNPLEDAVTIGTHPRTNETVKYKTMRLFVGSNHDPNPRQTVLFEEYEMARQQRKDKYRAVLFTPVDFPDAMAAICYSKVEWNELTKEEFVRAESGEPIQGNSVVEMRYDPKEPAGWRWIPMRIRADKNERFLKGEIAGALNSSMTANNVWNSIHNPITEYMITTGSEVPSVEERRELDSSKTAQDVLKKTYFERKPLSMDESKINGMRLFHRLYIKEKILYKGVFHGNPGRKLLDLAVGEAQDLPRWKSGHAGFILGVDYAGESITKPEKGAYGRLLNDMERRRKTDEPPPPMLFVVGDSSKRLITGEAGNEDIDKAILRAVFGNPMESDPVIPLVRSKGINQLAEGADAVMCMFALHYFFDKEETFNGLLQNIADTLKIGGYFVGCNFDGQKVFDALRGVKKGDAIRGETDEGKSILWEIVREYDEMDELPKDETGFGLPIDVTVVSIGSKHREYLVPWELLVQKMATIGCELVPADELKAIGLENSTNTFDNSFEMAKRDKSAGGVKRFEMPENVRQFSFMNRWYIFKRVSKGLGDLGKLVPMGEVGEGAGPAAEMAATAARAATGLGAVEGEEVEEEAGAGAAPRGTAVPTSRTRIPPSLAATAAAVEGTGTATEFMASIVPGGPAAARQMQATLAAALAAGNAETVRKLDEEAVRRGVAPPSAAEGGPIAPGALARTYIAEQGLAALPNVTVPVQRTAVALEAGKAYPDATLYKFGETIATKTNAALKLPVEYASYAARHMAPNARFRIRDESDPADTNMYPSIVHFLAGMKFKYASTTPDLANEFTVLGRIHKQFETQRELSRQSSKNKRIAPTDDLRLLNEETVQVKIREKEALADPRNGFDVGAWAVKENELLGSAILQRLRGDKWFCTIVGYALKQQKILVYVRPDDQVLGAVTKASKLGTKIEGQNKYGRMITELAEANPDLIRACVGS